MKLSDLVKEQNEKISNYFYNYNLIMNDIKSSGLDSDKIEKLSNAGTCLFDYMETCPATLDAVEEHETNEKTAQIDNLSGLFIDALKTTIPNHYKILQDYYKNENYTPSDNAFFCMQKLIIQTRSKQDVKSLIDICKHNKIPTKGLETKKRFKMTKNKKIILSTILAIISVISIAIFIFIMGELTPKQYSIATVFIAMLAGYSSYLLTGTIHLTTKKVTATSGVAVFFLVFILLNHLN